MTHFAYIADGWTTQGERLDATVLVIEGEARFRIADEGERARFYSEHWDEDIGFASQTSRGDA